MSEAAPLLEVLYRVMNENKQLRKAYQTLYQQVIHALMRCIEERDAYTYGHCMRVMQYSALIGRAAKLTSRELHNLELAAMLHDLGKLGIADCVLLKPDRLDDKEMTVMKTHATKGGEILTLIDAFREIAPSVLHHHERVDGKGYPDGLSASQIPLLSRVILVADTFDAMTSTRPYRKALPLETAYAELDRYAGRQFDREYVDIFLREHQRLVATRPAIIPLRKAA